MTQLTDNDLAYLDWLDRNQGDLRCCCQFPAHGQKYCDQPAAVTVDLHLPHVCRSPVMRANGNVNDDGLLTAILCRGCYQEARQYAEAKLAQIKALSLQRSTTCQRCNSGPLVMGGINGKPLTLMKFCPVCGLGRIAFDPICGLHDNNGISEGCGAKLTEVADIIRSENWLT